VALIYTSFSASTGVKEPSELIGAPEGTKAQVTGTVVPHSIEPVGNGISFRVRDRAEGESQTVSLSDPNSLPVTYHGSVPDPFRAGREIVLTGTMKSGTFVGEPETLVTKCPSKFTAQSDG
jgi:cytochrome c-type biogenesis protein CcmE